MNRFILTETELCIGCKTCEIACVLSHNGGDVDEIEPEGFFPRLKVVKEDGVTGAVACRHCEDAPCAAVCPNGAIYRAEDSIQVDQSRCIGCKTCVLACPYGAMAVHAVKAARFYKDEQVGLSRKVEAHKCDLCISRSNGPACVEVCPTKALYIVEPAEVKQEQEKRRKAALVAALNIV